MAIEMIPSLPPRAASTYVDTFFSNELASLGTPSNTRLLRLYLGRDLPSTISQLQPGLRSDLGLDVSRYIRFSHALQGVASLPPLADVAYGMGKVLSQMHFGVGIDGMDVELVLGGDGVHGVRCWLLDFNQCERWTIPRPLDMLGRGLATSGHYSQGDLIEGATRLATRIVALEHYYPRPHQKLYNDFRNGYLQTVESMLANHRPREPEVGWLVDAAQISAAAEAFVARYEAKALEAQETKARLAARRAKRIVL